MTTFLRFTENNDWEGETWHFYIPFDNPQIEIIKAILSSDDDRYGCYAIGEQQYTEEFVDKMVADSEGGYMQFHNKVSEVVIDPPAESEEDYDPFYKGKAFILEGE